MKVGFLSTGFNPCQWYRLYEPARAFAGAELIFAPGGEATPQALDAAAGCDVVQMNWVHIDAELELVKAIVRRGVTVAIDYDDDPRAILPDPAVQRVVRMACRWASLVTVSTPVVAGVLGPLARQIAVLPNRIDTNAWQPLAPKRRGPVVIAMAGSKLHTADFAAIAPAVWQAMELHANTILRVLGCRPLAVPAHLAARVEERPWVPTAQHREAIEALEADVAIAPLLDTAINRGRSPLKYLQFGALGVPLIAANLAPFTNTIRHGSTGLLASTESQWASMLTMLIRDSAQRSWLGRNAREDVRNFHDLRRDAPLRRAAYESIIRPAQRRIA